MEAAVNNYSIDILKKAAFLDELRNNLDLLPIDQKDEKIITVIEYFEKRIKQLDSKHKKN